MSQPRFSKFQPSPNLSFAEVLEEFSEENAHDSKSDQQAHFEWASIQENTSLLNHLLAESLQTNRFSSGNGFYRYAAHIKKMKTDIHRTDSELKNSSQESVPQPLRNPLWNTFVKTAFENINAPEIIHLTPGQNVLPVYYTRDDLKRIYRQRAKIAHPDQTTGSHLQFIELKKNYQILMDFLKEID